MNKKEDLLKKAVEGIATVSVGEKYKEAAKNNLEEWLGDNEEFEPYFPQIEAWIKKEKWDLILDAFFQIIPFGTGGRRGLVGVGTNRINTWTLRNSAQGHAQYLLRKHKDAKERGIVIAYGVRVFLDETDYDSSLPNPVRGLTAKQLAQSAAEVYAANGFLVFLFSDYRTTPELSFSIRERGAIAGIMVDASHNLPTDCGKKVFDSRGGQLIPPFDQELTDEVNTQVKEIKSIPFEQAKEEGLVESIEKEASEKYYQAVADLAFSKERDLKIVYSPLHGPGLYSVKPVLEKAGFQVISDVATENLSGKFENVKFNIPNPEVEESFEGALSFAAEKGADVILNSDPDADRVGIMVWHKKQWRYLNGNEIASILTDFSIKKRGIENGLVIKTDVTTGLVGKIAKQNEMESITDLLVGFKYIADEMNKLEDKGEMERFVFACEESHGYIAGGYARDKDAAIAALWLCELAAELKKEGKTLVDYLDEIYCGYGYVRNYLTEIRMLGAAGLENINKIQSELREKKPKKFGPYQVAEIKDWREGAPFVSKTDEVARNILTFYLEDIENRQIRVTVRPSGTEPKIKFYIEVICPSCKIDELDVVKKKADELRRDIEKNFMDYCYEVVGVDFPERGYLLFWQLPLNDKLRYFEIEEELASLREVENKDERKKKVDEILKFLGADPMDKVNQAFGEKYKVGVREYLDL